MASTSSRRRTSSTRTTPRWWRTSACCWPTWLPTVRVLLLLTTPPTPVLRQPTPSSSHRHFLVVQQGCSLGSVGDAKSREAAGGWAGRSFGAVGPASSCRPPQSAPAETVGHQAGCALTSGPPCSAHRGYRARAGVQWPPAPGQGHQGALHLQPSECPRAPTRPPTCLSSQMPVARVQGPRLKSPCVWFLMALLSPGAGFIRRDGVPKAGGRHATQLCARTVGSALRQMPQAPTPTPPLLPFPCMSPELPADWSPPEAWGGKVHLSPPQGEAQGQCLAWKRPGGSALGAWLGRRHAGHGAGLVNAAAGRSRPQGQQSNLQKLRLQ